MLKRNSEAFQKKESKHIDGFKKAQSLQKKNIDWIMSANRSITLAPLTSAKNRKLKKTKIEVRAGEL